MFSTVATKRSTRDTSKTNFHNFLSAVNLGVTHRRSREPANSLSGIPTSFRKKSSIGTISKHFEVQKAQAKTTPTSTDITQMTLNPNSGDRLNEEHSGELQELLNIPALINGLAYADETIEGRDHCDDENADDADGQLVSKKMLIGTVRALVEYFDEKIKHALAAPSQADVQTYPF